MTLILIISPRINWLN